MDGWEEGRRGEGSDNGRKVADMKAKGKTRGAIKDRSED